MSLKPTPRYLDVWLHDQHIGWLCDAGGATRFLASENYIADRRRPTLSMSMTMPRADWLTQKVLGNHFDPAVYREHGELPPFFAGLLPEGPLKRRLAATRHNGIDMDDFGILAAAGEDLPGALKLIPANLDQLTLAAKTYGVTGGVDELMVTAPEGSIPGGASLSGMQNKLAMT